MSLKELESLVQQLPKPDLAKFSQWFDLFRGANVLAGGAWGDIQGVQQNQAFRRRAFLKLPLEQRRRILAAQAGKLQKHYENDDGWKATESDEFLEHQ